MPLSLSAMSIEFVVSMLEYDPARRPSAAQLLEHPFVRLHCPHLNAWVPTGLPMGRDDTAHDLDSDDKKGDGLQVCPLAQPWYRGLIMSRTLCPN